MYSSGDFIRQILISESINNQNLLMQLTEQIIILPLIMLLSESHAYYLFLRRV